MRYQYKLLGIECELQIITIVTCSFFTTFVLKLIFKPKNMKINNREVIQSYLFTTARYDFSVYEKRILYRVVEMVQESLEGKKLRPSYSIDATKYHDRVITMPTTAFLANEKDQNHIRVKEALLSLEGKRFELENDKLWKIIRVINMPQLDKEEGFVTFRVQPEVYDAILNFSKGFRKYELKTAMEFESHYAMRFYELFSNQTQPINYEIEELKTMFGIEEKYKDRPAEFITYVVEKAKKELDKKSPYSFKYDKLKRGRKIHTLRFFPKYLPKNADKDLEQKQIQKTTSLRWDIDKPTLDFLRHSLEFTDTEINNNRDLFCTASKELDLLEHLSLLKGRSRTKKSPKAYVIGALKAILGE